MDELWKFITDNAAELSAVAAVFGAVVGFIALFKRGGKPKPEQHTQIGGDQVGRDKAGGDVVGGDKTGRDKIGGDRVGGDQTTVGGDQIKIGTRIINEAARAASVAARGLFQLPAANPDFVGRGEKLAEIKEALKAGGAAVTASVEGMGGIGKTETVLVAAHELIGEGRFKDAQVFIDLRGFTPGAEPKDTATALEELLRPFVPPDAPLSEDAAQRAALWREVTAGRDMRLVLDNAHEEAQVTPLLTGHPGCVTVVTSRNKLNLRGITPVPLDEMDSGEAANLAMKLANRRNPDRIDRTEADRLADLCGRLPLAIELAAGTLDVAQGWRPESFLDTIADQSRALATLKQGERELEATLAASLATLDYGARIKWATLGVFEGGFDGSAAHALWQVDDENPILADFDARNLVDFDRASERYRLHDLLRALGSVLN